MALLAFSTPFFRPLLHTSMPNTTTITMNNSWMPTSWVCMAVNASPTWAVVMPSNWPRAILQK